MNAPLAGLWLSSFLTDYLKSTTTPTAAGFLSVMLANAHQWIAALKTRGITDCIAWDLSFEKAQQNSTPPKPRSPYAALWYVGDVGCLDPLFPASSVRTFAKAFSDAGIALGHCARTGEIVRTVDGRARRVPPEDWGYNLCDKIARAQALGLTGPVYVDSGILALTRASIPANLFGVVRQQFPALPIAFEHVEPSVYGNPPSYPVDFFASFNGYFTPTPTAPPPTPGPNNYPWQGPFWIHPSDYAPWLEAQFGAFVAAVKGGARCIGRGMYPGDPLWGFLDRIYAAAAVP